jgi:chemotaxis protein CheD
MDMPYYFINPGELIFSKKPIFIRTVLGSCVAVVLYDRVKKYAGLVHYLLPQSPDKSVSTKFGDVAVSTLINKFTNAGSVISNLDAHIAGGAFIIFDDSEIFFIGDRNIEIAQNTLKANNIRVRSTNTGGERGRRLTFDSSENKLTVSVIDKMQIDDLYESK